MRRDLEASGRCWASERERNNLAVSINWGVLFLGVDKQDPAIWGLQ